MSKPVHISQRNFGAEVVQSALPVLVDFWATWCGPCRMIAPIVEDLAREYEGRLKVGKVDVDENPDLASRYGVQSIPTLLVFVGGQPFTRIVGYAPKAELKRAIDTALSATRSHTPVGAD